jgi:hypothetical protein
MKSLEGVLHHSILGLFLTSSRCDRVFQHHLLLQVLLLHPGQLLLLFSVLLLLWSMFLL